MHLFCLAKALAATGAEAHHSWPPIYILIKLYLKTGKTLQVRCNALVQLSQFRTLLRPSIVIIHTSRVWRSGEITCLSHATTNKNQKNIFGIFLRCSNLAFSSKLVFCSFSPFTVTHLHDFVCAVSSIRHSFAEYGQRPFSVAARGKQSPRPAASRRHIAVESRPFLIRTGQRTTTTTRDTCGQWRVSGWPASDRRKQLMTGHRPDGRMVDRERVVSCPVN